MTVSSVMDDVESAESTESAGTVSAVHDEGLRERALAARRAGMSFREIGAQEGLSHEHVRKVLEGVLTEDDRANAATRRTTERRQAVDAWLGENGPVTRDLVLAEFDDVTPSILDAMIASGEMDHAHMILMTARTRDVEFSDDEITGAIQRAWKRVKFTDPDARGLSLARYGRTRLGDEPGTARILTRAGSWAEACKRAGVPRGAGGARPESSYGSAWSREDLLAYVAEYMDTCEAEQTKATYMGYETWQQGVEGAPSGSTLRNRFYREGVRSWPEILRMARA